MQFVHFHWRTVFHCKTSPQFNCPFCCWETFGVSRGFFSAITKSAILTFLYISPGYTAKNTLRVKLLNPIVCTSSNSLDNQNVLQSSALSFSWSHALCRCANHAASLPISYVARVLHFCQSDKSSGRWSPPISFYLDTQAAAHNQGWSRFPSSWTWLGCDLLQPAECSKCQVGL